MFDFVVHTSVYDPVKNTDCKEYCLSDYTASEKETAFCKLKKAVLSDLQKKEHIYWISVGLFTKVGVSNTQCIYRMQGDKTWFSGVEYFRKFQGDMGGSISDTPLSYGFIDQKNKIRVEFENGSVILSEIK